MTFQFPACFAIASKLTLIIQGKQELHLRFQGSVTFPELKLSPERIQMGRVRTASSVTHQITATNSGDNELIVEFQLAEYPEFRVHAASDTRDSPIDYLDDYYSTSVNHVKIPAKSTRYVNLEFEPIDLASYGFYLPIVLNGKVGPVNSQDPESLKPQFHLQEQEKYYERVMGLQLANLPKKLSTIYIDCTVSLPTVKFNKTRFNLDATKSFVTIYITLAALKANKLAN